MLVRREARGITKRLGAELRPLGLRWGTKANCFFGKTPDGGIPFRRPGELA
jgi:hypothetical protein